MANKTTEELKTAWWNFHKSNPRVYELFRGYAFQLIKKGFSNYSSKSIFERIRWHSDVETTEDKFKLNNNHTAYYSRLFAVHFPKYKNFFRIRGDK
jgi:hypothetical protein